MVTSESKIREVYKGIFYFLICVWVYIMVGLWNLFLYFSSFFKIEKKLI